MAEVIVRTVQTVTRCSGYCAPHTVVAWLDVHSGLAAWMQAILIPLTIVGTLAAAILPSALERKRRQRLLLRSATEVAAMAAGMFGVLKHVAKDKTLRGTNVQRISDGYLISPLEAISAFPLHEIENKAATGQLRLIEMRLRSALDLLPSFNNAVQSGVLSKDQEDVIIETYNELVAAHGIIAAEAGVKPEAPDGKDDEVVTTGS